MTADNKTPTKKSNMETTPQLDNADDGSSQHPLVLRLLAHAESPFIIYSEPEGDIKLAAKLIQDQHDGISKALEAVLDGEIESCIHFLMVASNEYSFTQNADVDASADTATPNQQPTQ